MRPLRNQERRAEIGDQGVRRPCADLAQKGEEMAEHAFERFRRLRGLPAPTKARDPHQALHAGDWCYLLSKDDVQQNAEPYFISAVEPGSDGQQYARFYEIDGGWLLSRCEKTAPPAPVSPPDAVEEC